MDYRFLLTLGIIIISTKLLGILCKKINLPEVVGSILAGILIGPSCLKLVTMDGDASLTLAAEVGVILLMFSAGLETDLRELKKNALASFVIALIGVIVPLVCGTLCYALYFNEDLTVYHQLLKSIFIGVVLTATSVSITVETLREMGKLGGKVGTTILGAAIIDDILGIIVLSVVTSLQDTSVQPSIVLVKILLYAVFIGILFLIVTRLRFVIEKADGMRRVALFALAFCFILAFLSEEFFGVADITGAYFAGLMLCMSQVKDYIEIKMTNLSTMFFSCIFFACIGIKVTLDGMTPSLWIFAIILTVVAILTKVIGCGLGAKMCRYKNKEALQIGIGMISRGEVALVVVDKGHQVGLIDTDMFAPVVVMVIVTTLITPILLKLVFKEKANKDQTPEDTTTTAAQA